MKKNIFINFCLRQHPDYGGTYTAQSLFRRTLNSYFIDLKIPSYDNPSEAQYTVPLSTNPLLGYLKSTNRDFFSFIPNEIKNNTVGIIAHSTFLAQFSYAFNLSRYLNQPLYLVPHGATDPYVFSYGKTKKRIWLETIGNAAAKRAKKIIFSTEAEQNKSVFQFSDSKGVICPFAVEAPQNIDKSYSKTFLRQHLGLSDSDKILLYFSKLDNFKRPIETIESFLKIKPKNWKLLIVGYYQDLSLKAKIDTYAKNPNIVIHPPVFGQDKWNFLAGSDMFVLFSHRENFGFSVAEAASVGTPVLISRGVDIHPYFESLYNQLIFDIKSEEDIDRAIYSLESFDEYTIRSLGEICRDIVLENFSFENFSHCLKKKLGVV